jgi:transcriptional regulator with XRE-family HTH domain
MAKPRRSLADRIQSLRTERGWTQNQLAEKADLPNSTLTDLEYGVANDPKLSTLLKLSKAFGIGLDELVFGKKK